MRSLLVFALPEVENDLRAAMAHYATWRSEGAAHVLQKYAETIGWIAWNPEAFPRKYGFIRRAILKQSYFVVYYIEERERTLVLAVLDGRREPRTIRQVIKNRRGRSK